MYSVAEDDLELPIFLDSVFSVLGLQVCATTPGFFYHISTTGKNGSKESMIPVPSYESVGLSSYELGGLSSYESGGLSSYELVYESGGLSS